MNAQEAKATIDWVSANWRQEITEDQAVVWYEVLADLDQRMVLLAIKELRAESTFVPDFKLLLDRYHVVARRQAALGPGAAPRHCELCEGSGWELVPVVGNVEAYSRCRCQKRKEGDHRGGCTCLSCHYGERAKDIRAGVDGLRGPVDMDDLAVIPAPRFDQSAF